MLITTYEASQKYKLSTGYLRTLLGKKVIKGRHAPFTSRRSVWLLDEISLKQFLKKERRPGPKPKKKTP